MNLTKMKCTTRRKQVKGFMVDGTATTEKMLELHMEMEKSFIIETAIKKTIQNPIFQK